MKVDSQMYELACAVMAQLEARCPKHGQHLKPKCDCGVFEIPAYRLANLVWGHAMFGKDEEAK
jgi:hypothetical protein